jgi:hypothetical protein
LFANISLQASVYGMQRVLGTLLATGSITPEMQGEVVNWEERQRVVRKPYFDALEEHYESSLPEVSDAR